MARFLLLLIATFCVLGAPAPKAAESGSFAFKDDMLRVLVERVPDLLKAQDKETGRFGKGIWIVQDQHKMWPLAVAWGTKHPDNPYHHSPELLEAVMAAGDALIGDQDEKGMWVFRKKDGSTWGDIYMPWTYSRWVRSFSIIQEAMPAERRAKWEKALTLGYSGIAARELETVHNIPAYHATGLYNAGKALNRPEWCEQAKAFMKKLVAKQDPGGFWSENYGPVVGYNFVYMEALGLYYGMSGDDTVLPALQRGARYHANFTYPDGTAVETVDERQVYHHNVVFPNLGFDFSPEGRGYLKAQWNCLKDKGVSDLGADGIASHIVFGKEGDTLPTPGEKASHHFVLGDNQAVIHRQGSWFACLSAYHTDVPTSRWIQDRQNFVSLYHDRVGLIVGGGNTKLQPHWSTFCVGNPDLFKHTAGDENPNFTPPQGIAHVPQSAKLDPGALALEMAYGSAHCEVDVNLSLQDSARIVFTVEPDTLTSPVVANITFIPKEDAQLDVPRVKRSVLKEDDPFTLTNLNVGPSFSYGPVLVDVLGAASLRWPVYGHNPYKKAGEGSYDFARLVLVIELTREKPQCEVTFVLEEEK